MPGMDGLEAARRIRALPDGDAHLLVAVTGWGQERDRQPTSEAGFDAHLVKPADPLALRALIARAPTDAGPATGAQPGLQPAPQSTTSACCRREQDDARRQRQTAGNRRQRDALVLFGGRLDRPDVDDLFPTGVVDAADGEADDADHDEQDADCHFHVALSTDEARRKQTGCAGMAPNGSDGWPGIRMLQATMQEGRPTRSSRRRISRRGWLVIAVLFGGAGGDHRLASSRG